MQSVHLCFLLFRLSFLALGLPYVAGLSSFVRSSAGQLGVRASTTTSPGALRGLLPPLLSLPSERSALWSRVGGAASSVPHIPHRAVSSGLSASPLCSVKASWSAQWNVSMADEELVAAQLVTPSCMLLYMTAFYGNTAVLSTHIGAIDIKNGRTLWTLPFPHNEVSTVPLPPFFQLSSNDELLLAQRIFFPNDTTSCVEMWGIDIDTTAATVRWTVVECQDLTGTLGWVLGGGLLFPSSS